MEDEDARCVVYPRCLSVVAFAAILLPFIVWRIVG